MAVLQLHELIVSASDKLRSDTCRIIATINRGLAVRDFGMGNFFVLCLNVARLTWTNAWRQRSVALLSRGLDPHPHP